MIFHISDRHVTTSMINHDITEFHRDDDDSFRWYHYSAGDDWFLGDCPVTYAADVSVFGVEHLWGERIPEDIE